MSHSIFLNRKISHIGCLAIATVLVFLLLCPPAAISQTSPPLLRVFSNRMVGTHTRIDSIDAGRDGVIYAATGNEIAAFDGANWLKIKLPSDCVSLQVGLSDKVWVCQKNEIGYVQKDQFGQFEYHKFETEFDNHPLISFWDCSRTSNGVRFANNNLILDIDETADPPKATATLAEDDETFFSWNRGDIVTKNMAMSELFVVKDSKRVRYPEYYKADDHIDCVVPITDEVSVFVCNGWKDLRIRKDDDWTSFSPEFDRLNDSSDLRWVLPLSGERLGCGGKKGFFCIDKDGVVEYQVSAFGNDDIDGLHTWKEFADHRIGITSENGIAILTPPQSRGEWPLFDSENVAIYRACCVDGHAYLCSKYGLYEIALGELTSRQSSLPEPIERSTCNDVSIDATEQIFASSSGVLRRQKKGLEKVAEKMQLSIVRYNHEHWITSDNNNVIGVYRLENGLFHKIQSFRWEQSIPELKVQDELLWFSTEYGDVDVIQFPQGLENEKVRINVISEVDYRSAQAHGMIGDDFLVVTDKGILISKVKPILHDTQTKDKTKSNSVKPDISIELVRNKRYERLSELVRDNNVKQIVACGENRLALIGEKLITVHEAINDVFQSDALVQWEVHPTNTTVFWDDKHQLMWQIEMGKLVSIDIDNYKAMPLDRPTIVASTFDDARDGTKELAFRGNIKMSFGLPLGNHHLENVQYQHRLKGLKNEWTNWSTTSEIEYQGLPGGKYEFEARARNGLGETTISTMGFSVRYPWYLSWAAIATWACLFGLTVYGVTAWRSRSLTAANRKMEELVAERTDEIEQKKREIQRNAALLDESERRSESERLTSLDTLVAGIAHDFNNLLMVMSANNEMIKFSGDASIEKFADNNTVVIQSAADLCRELTDYSGSLPMELISTSLNQIVHESNELIVNAAGDGIEISYDLAAEVGQSSMLADPRLLKRALVNLVVNAVECCNGKVLIETAHRMLTQHDLQDSRYVGNPPVAGQYCSVSVTDDGGGIRPEQMERLFDPFFSTKKLGRGLGLAIVMRVTGRLNGVIFVDSQLGHGARFELCFPATPWRIENGHNAGLHNNFVCEEKFRLMLIDDEKFVLESTEQMLAIAGHQVTAFIEQKNALQALFENEEPVRNFDCAVIDVSMPGMSGPEMAEIILDQIPEMPIVLVSGHNNSSFEFNLLNKPNVNFLRKPYTIDQMNKAIYQSVRGVSTS